MSTEPLRRERTPDRASEARLLEIRSEAEKHGRVISPGVRLQGAPFPVASPETGYYGIHMLKEPQWTWEIPLYFFVGGAAGSAGVIASFADWIAGDHDLADDARWVAAGGAVLSTALLISDLGMPSRFLNMLRVFKAQSPISVGAWTLAAFGSASGAALFAQIVEKRFGPSVPVHLLGNLAQLFTTAFGLPLHNYTGVLIGATAIPVWNHNIFTLPIHFGMSGLNSGVAVLELMGNADRRSLNLLGIAACAMETYEGYHLEMKRDPEINQPLKHGLSGWITRAGGVLSGPLPLTLRLASLFMRRGQSERIRRVAAWSSIAGSMLTRYGWVHAGHASARNWRLPLGIKEKQTIVPEEMQSRSELPKAKVAS